MSLERLRKRYLLELRLGTLSWFYIVVYCIWAAVTALLTLNLAVTAEQYLVQTTYLTYIVLLSLLTLTVTIVNASRSERAHFSEIERSLPYGFETPFAHFLANFTMCALLLLPPIIAALMLGPFISFLRGVPPFLAATLITIAVVSLIASWVTERFGSKPLTYFITLVIWLAFAVAPNLFGHTVSTPSWTTLLSVLRVGTDPILYEELYGTALQGQLYNWFNLFYLGIVGVMVAVWIQAFRQRQFGQSSYVVWGLLIPSLCVAVYAAFTYSQEITQGRLTARTDELNLQMSNNLLTQLPFRQRYVTATVYDVKFQQEINIVKLDVEMTLHNHSSHPVNSVLLKLYHGFEIVALDYPFHRIGDTLLIEFEDALPQERRRSIHISYQGHIEQVNLYGGRPRLYVFANDSGVYLPYTSMWYPTVSHHDRADVEVPHEPADLFRLEIVSAPFLITSNLPSSNRNIFSGENVSWVTLIGSPRLDTMQTSLIRAAFSDVYVSDLEWLIQNTHDIFDAYQPFFPSVSVTEVKLLSTKSVLGTLINWGAVNPLTSTLELSALLPPSRHQILVGLSPYFFSDLEATKAIIGRLIVDNYWFHLGGDLKSNVIMREAINQFLWAIYLYEENKAAPLSNTAHPLTRALMDVYNEYGVEHIALVFEQLPLQASILHGASYENLVEWMKGI